MLQYRFNWKTLSAMAGVTWWNFYFRLSRRLVLGHGLYRNVYAVTTRACTLLDNAA